MLNPIRIIGESIITAWQESTLIENQTAAYITGLTHRVRSPKENNRLEKHPVLLLVHGRHGNEDVPWIFARNIPDHWLIVAPRGIEFEPESAEHETGYSWIEMPPTGWPDIEVFDGAVQALSDFVQALPEVYGADPERVIVMGFSQGAAVALATAIQHPHIFSGIASLVGFVPSIVPSINDTDHHNEDEERVNGQPLKNVPVWMAAGERDERIPLEIAIASRDTVQAAGADVRWEVYETGHKLNGKGMRDLTAWLKGMIE